MPERADWTDELGHYVLPWHNSLLQSCSETDLSPAARQVWEREANLFAMACLFQGAGFAREADRAGFGLNTLRRLARRWEASLEAAGREYVERYASLETMVGGYEDLIDEIYSQRRSEA